MTALLSRLEYVLTGEATGGECPGCGHATLTVSEAGLDCSRCGFDEPLPEVPDW